MGGIAVDLDGRSSVAGALRGRRVQLHRPARRQPAGLELAQRVLRVRQAGRPRGRSASPPSLTPARSPGWRFDPPTEQTRESVWRLAGPLRRPEELAELLDDPYPLAAAIAGCALERRESRGGHRRVDFPDTDPSLDGTHFVLGADGELRAETWL